MLRRALGPRGARVEAVSRLLDLAPCATDQEPSAFSGGAIEAPSAVSAYSTRGGHLGVHAAGHQAVALHRPQASG